MERDLREGKRVMLESPSRLGILYRTRLLTNVAREICSDPNLAIRLVVIDLYLTYRLALIYCKGPAYVALITSL